MQAAERLAEQRGAALADAERARAELRERAQLAAQDAAQLRDALAVRDLRASCGLLHPYPCFSTLPRLFLQAATTTNDNIKNLLTTRTDEIRNLEKIINDKSQVRT